MTTELPEGDGLIIERREDGILKLTQKFRDSLTTSSIYLNQAEVLWLLIELGKEHRDQP